MAEPVTGDLDAAQDEPVEIDVGVLELNRSHPAPFNALSDRDMDRLRKEVQRLAALLRSRVALRQKRAKTGQLDAKATIRANLKHGNVPIEMTSGSQLKPACSHMRHQHINAILLGADVEPDLCHAGPGQ
jgi:uncharacterized protein with von Willebrand factor type A (vWA) domain